MAVRLGFRALLSRAIHHGTLEGHLSATAQDRLASFNLLTGRREPTYGLDSAMHPSTAPMDTSPVRIVCSNRLDTAG